MSPPRLAGVDRAVAAALFLITLALYAPVRHHAFLNYDDNEYVTDQPVVRAGLTRSGLAWALTSAHQATWHPLTTLTHMLDVELFGLDAGAHLLVNVVLHALATVVLFLVLHALTGDRWPSAWVAAAFAWHPLHVESVAWVSERKDVLSGLFWMLTLAAYGAYARRPTLGRWLGVAAVFALGLLAKPMLVTLPFVLLLFDYWPLRRFHVGDHAWVGLVREKIPLFALAAVASVVTVVAQRNAGALNTLASAPFSYRVGNALVSYATYVRKTVWPNDLMVFYPPAPTLSAWTALAAGALLVVVSALALACARRAPYLPVGWLWYLGTLVPVIGLVRQGDQAMADRFTYLPSIGLFVMVAWGARALVARPAAVRVLAVASVLVLAACGAATSRQLAYWRSSRTLFAHALAVDPDNYLAHSNLGVALAADGRHDEAMAHYERAVALQPTYAKARLNLGGALARSGRVDAAEAEYREALRLDPDSALAAYDLGLLLAESGRLDEAIALYRRALALDPRYAKAWNNLGWALAAEGQLADAVTAYERALAVDPALTAAHNDLAVALEGLGRNDEALAHYAAAVRLAPDEPRAHANYAAVLASRGRYDEAIAARARAASGPPPGATPPTP
jgi:Flp pilus assembly protein TadD